MSVLIEFSIFPTDKGLSVSHYVSKVIKMIKSDYSSYLLTPMGTVIETSTLAEALVVVEKAYAILERDSERVYATMKLDIQKNKDNRIRSKIVSIEQKIGAVNS